jgi:hypothetical protein
MSLTILIRGMLNSIPVLSDACYTKQNYGVRPCGNTTLSINTPRGVLGGSVAAVSGGLDYTVVPCTDVLRPVGLSVNDAAGAAFENSPAVASGKVAVMKCMASVEVDVYETVRQDNVTPTVFTVGALLYSSAQGLLTDEVSNETNPPTIIGICMKKPTTASPTLGLDMRI